MGDPTPRQLQCLATIVELGMPPPTRRELAVALGVSVSRAQALVIVLRDAELLEVGRGPRALRLTPAGRQALEQATCALELPDSAHRGWRNRYVFRHPRDAIRCWVAHRDGRPADRARGGSPGRSPALGDVVRVGRVLAGITTGPQMGMLVDWARGKATTTDDRVEALVDRVSQRFRQLGLVAPASVRPPELHRSAWIDADGGHHETDAPLEKSS